MTMPNLKREFPALEEFALMWPVTSLFHRTLYWCSGLYCGKVAQFAHHASVAYREAERS